MSRYIDAEWLKTELGDVNMDIYTDEVKEYIDSAPSIDIVFCEDCLKHKVVPFGENACFYWCELRGHAINYDDYCSYGEREGE